VEGGTVASMLAATPSYLKQFAFAVPAIGAIPDRFYATFTFSRIYYLSAPRWRAPQRRYLWKERRFYTGGVADGLRRSKPISMRRLFWFACFLAAVAGPYLWSNPEVAAAWKARALTLLQQLTAAPANPESHAASGPYDGQTVFRPVDGLDGNGFAPDSGPVNGFDGSRFGANGAGWNQQDGVSGEVAEHPFVSTLRPLDSQAVLPVEEGDDPPQGSAPGPRLAGPAVTNFDSLFRFEVGPEWVTDHWSRVSTVRSDEGWLGLRVPVVTGMAPDDLAGSLTYYFDAWRRLQRVAFHGTTGDARRVIAWSANQGLRREPAVAAELFTRRWNGRATSVLAIQRPAVISSQRPNQRQEVLLEISPPDSRSEVSREMQAWLRTNRPGR